jgi:predicted N-acetyltransferase YhbS
MITIRNERTADIAAREALLDKAMGKIKRRRKTSERLRSGRLPADGLAFVATDGERIVGSARLWNIGAESGEAALLLGPMAVASDCRNRGIGGALVRRAVDAARSLGHRAIILVGDAPYYSRFGFTADKTAAGPIVMIGFGSIGKGTLPLIERHFDSTKRFVVIDPHEDRELLDERGMRFIQQAVTRDNYRECWCRC